MSAKKDKDENSKKVIEIQNIKTWENYIRRYTDEDLEAIDKFSKSIEKNGLKYPILVHENADGECILVDGLKRLKACQRLGWAEIPVSYVDKEPLLSTWIANIDREDINPIQKSDYLWFIRQHLGNPDWKIVAAKLNHDASIVSRLKTLIDLPAAIKDRERDTPHYGINKLYAWAQRGEDKALELYNKAEEARKRKEEREADPNTPSKRDPAQTKANWIARISGFSERLQKKYISGIIPMEDEDRKALRQLYDTLSGLLDLDIKPTA